MSFSGINDDGKRWYLILRAINEEHNIYRWNRDQISRDYQVIEQFAQNRSDVIVALKDQQLKWITAGIEKNVLTYMTVMKPWGCYVGSLLKGSENDLLHWTRHFYQHILPTIRVSDPNIVIDESSELDVAKQLRKYHCLIWQITKGQSREIVSNIMTDNVSNLNPENSEKE